MKGTGTFQRAFRDLHVRFWANDNRNRMTSMLSAAVIAPLPRNGEVAREA